MTQPSPTSEERPLTLLVVAAILVRPDGCVLVTQRPEGKPYAGWWEFPGGKVEKNESPETALVRELQEELGITAREEDFEPFTFISEDCGKFHLLMPLYLLPHWEGTPSGRENQQLQWVRPSALNTLQLLKPDLPVVPKLQAHFQDFPA